MSQKIELVDALVTKAIAAGDFTDKECAAEAIHEWLLHHKQLHSIHAVDVGKTTMSPKAAVEEAIGEGKFQLEVMRNQDA